MTGPVLLMALGVMIGLAGLLLGAATLAGVQIGPAPRGRRRDRTPVGGRTRLSRRWMAAVLAGLAVFLLTGWVAVGIGTAAAVIGIPIVIGKTRAEQQITRLTALAAWTRRLADLLSSGAAGSLDTAIRRSALAPPPAMAAEVAALVTRMNAWGPRKALLGLAHDLGDPAADQVVLTLVTHERHGGAGLSSVLSALAGDLEEAIRSRRDIEADRAEPRATARNLIVITLAVMLGLTLFFGSFLQPYHTALGQLLLAGIVAIFAGALAWMWFIIRPATSSRLLVAADFAEAGLT